MDLHKVFIIDDEPEIQEICGEILEGNFEVEKYGNAESAIQAVKRKGPPDLFITDISMPGMSGLDFVKWLRSQKIDKPVIIISGVAEKSDAIEALELGAYSIIEKPLEVGVIFSAANRASAFLLLKEINKEMMDSYQIMMDAMEMAVNMKDVDLKSILKSARETVGNIRSRQDKLEKLYDILNKAAGKV